MAHDHETCERICKVVSLIAVTELDNVKKGRTDLDYEAFVHGFARGAGQTLAAIMLAAGIPPMLRHAALVQAANMIATQIATELVELTKDDTSELAEATPQGRA